MRQQLSPVASRMRKRCSYGSRQQSANCNKCHRRDHHDDHFNEHQREFSTAQSVGRRGIRDRNVFSDTLAKPQPSLALNNAAAESRLLHLRNLCEIFLESGHEADDIKMSNLFSGWATDSCYAEVKTALGKLRTIYGKRDDSSSPRWIINKRLAHSTSHRAAAGGYDYTPHLRNLVPALLEVLQKIESLRGSTFERYQ